MPNSIVVLETETGVVPAIERQTCETSNPFGGGEHMGLDSMNELAIRALSTPRSSRPHSASSQT
jgi:hypothetical protein